MLDMEVQLTSDQQAKLTRMAAEQGRAAETLVQEAVERFLNYDEWFSLQVDKGLAAADREMIMSGLPFVTIYRVGQEAVEIARILHTSQQWP